jgi:UDP-glucose-4-epimerase GalE
VKWGPFEKGDILNKQRLDEVFKKYKPEAVMHFAAFAYVGESVTEPAKYYENNLIGSLNLLETMRQNQVNKFVFSSTCATYGVPTQIPISEDHPQAPINPYGRTKLMIEWGLQDYCAAYDMRAVSLRYFNAAGADPEGETGEDHDPETHLIPLVLDAALGKRPSIQIYGDDYDTPDGTCIRDYIHVTDLADAHVRALEFMESNAGFHAYNLGNGNGFSVKQVIDVAATVTGKEIPVEIVERRAGDPSVLVGDAKKINRDLDWEPRYTDLKEIIQTAWNWHKRDK